MAVASSGTRVAESLKRVYNELDICQEDIDCLTNAHGICTSQDLVMKKQRLERKELVGVSEPAQVKLEIVAEYIESSPLPDPLANFTQKEYYEYLEEPLDFSAATGVKTGNETKDNPICCDSSIDEEEARGEEEAQGKVTFKCSASSNPSSVHVQLPITVVKVQGVTSSSNELEENKSIGPSTESETVEDIDKLDCFDLSEQERQMEMARVRDSKLSMMKQGFADSPKVAYESEPDSSALEITDSHEGVDGLVLQKGYCYHCKQQEGVILGIVSFVFEGKEVMAKCVLVVPYSVTFLGVEGIENPIPGGVGGLNNFFQVRKDIGLFPRSSFTRVCIEPGPTTIPNMIYEPRTFESPQTFGYVYDNKGSNRVGRTTEMRVIDLFCGAGGMHQGYKDAGFKTVMAVDLDPMAMDTFKANNPGVTVYEGNVKQILEDCKTKEDFRQRVGRYDVVHASPPCSPFSSLNRHKTGDDYLANRELSDKTFIEFIREFDPKAVIYENVEGILQQQNRDVFVHIVTELIRMGYQVRSTVLKACDFGDAQMRKRLFIFAAKSFVLMPSLPMPTHGDGPNLLPYVTAKNALEKLRSADPDKIPNIVDCKTTTNGAGVNGVVQLDADKLAPTVRAGGPAVLHYAEGHRCLNVRENAALQSFPDNYKFFGGTKDNLLAKYRQVGNAVPLKLGTAIARSVKDSLEFEYEEELDKTSTL